MKFLYVSIQIQYHLKHLQGKLLRNNVKYCSQQNYDWIYTQMGIAYNVKMIKCSNLKIFTQTQTVNMGITVINILSYESYAHTSKLSNQNVVFIRYDVLVGCFCTCTRKRFMAAKTRKPFVIEYHEI